jgi:hypothetical protein
MLSRRSAIAFLTAAAGAFPARAAILSPAFDFTDWVLQLPGPIEIKALDGYKSQFFQLDAQGRLQFWIDAGLSGSTAHSNYVRAELRHRANWSVRGGRRSLAARLSIAANLSPSQVTVLQIHGVTADGDNAPPLARIALVDGTPTAWVKTDAAGEHTERIALGPPPGERAFDCRIAIDDGVLSVAYDGAPPIQRDLRFWPYDNYFKAGLYPQAHQGQATAWFTRLSVVV